MSLMAATCGLSSSTEQWRKRCGCRSAAQKVSRSTAARRACLREGTKTSTGRFGECWHMARYTGLIIATSRDGVCEMVKPCVEAVEVDTAPQRLTPPPSQPTHLNV